MKTKVFAAFIVIIIAIGFGLLSLLLSGEAYAIPTVFIESRKDGAAAAEKISTMINESLETLTEVAAYEERGDLASAVFLIRTELGKTGARQEQAQILAGAMEKMARAIIDIKPDSAQQIALEAVSTQVATVSRLVSYNENLSDLFNLLNDRMRGDAKATPEKIDRLVKRLNNESEAIGELNTQFNKSLAQFDAIFTGKLETETASAL